MRKMNGDVATAPLASSSSTPLPLAKFTATVAGTSKAPRLRTRPWKIQRSSHCPYDKEVADSAEDADKRTSGVHGSNLNVGLAELLIRDERLRERRVIRRNIDRRVELGMEAYEEDLESRRDKLRELLVREEAELTRELVEAARRIEEERAAELQKRALVAEEEREHARLALLRDKRLQHFAENSQEVREERRRFRCEDTKKANLAMIANVEERRRREREEEAYWHEVQLEQSKAAALTEASEASRRATNELRAAETLLSQMEAKSQQRQQQQQQQLLRRRRLRSEESRREEEALRHKGGDNGGKCEGAALGLRSEEQEKTEAAEAHRKKLQLREDLERQLLEARQSLEKRRAEEEALDRMMTASIDKANPLTELDQRRDREARRREILAFMDNMREYREAVARREAEAEECLRHWSVEADNKRLEALTRAKENRIRREQELRLAWDRQLEEKRALEEELRSYDYRSFQTPDSTSNNEAAERIKRHRSAVEYGRELLTQRDEVEARRARERRALDDYYEMLRLEKEREEQRLAQELKNFESRLRISGVP